jgi:hypothetical protein
MKQKPANGHLNNCTSFKYPACPWLLYLALLGIVNLIGLAVALSLSLRCSASEVGDHANEIEALRLVQSHSFLGASQLTISPRNMRMDSTGQMHFSLVASAPDWTVTVFRADDKVIKSESLKQFTNTGLVSEIVLSERPRILQSTAPPYPFKYYGLDARRVTNTKASLEYLAPGEMIAPAVEKIVFAIYRMPTGGGIPLHFIEREAGRDFITGMKMNGNYEVCLKTISAKTIWVPRTFFAVPNNYRQAKDMQEVLTSASIRSQSADFENLLEPAHVKGAGTGKP